ncbi:hypothetical protein [Gemmatimonas groenlandica]|uniref:DUF4168 domain-containing protein n=1 Tax=Gemmatimonas groenlandica TaxID=2732249 RepID=A0A6M4IRE3_9BACT|nr:hypothetical protein [Gemmatimonas groenlandica]QJR36077.1 hypothetical protein HKW67_11455 [Gemmatimonas groenlandica]
MPLRAVRPLLATVGLAFALLAAGAVPLSAQDAPKRPTGVPAAEQMPADSIEAMMAFARAYLAQTALRERADAAYAEPKNKKPEELAGLREKYRLERDALLKSHGFTDVTYARATQRVSGDDTARLAFEAALAKVTAK